MKLIREKAIVEFVEKKSRFIGYAFPVASKEEAEEILSALWKEHRKCTHICTAIQLGLKEKWSDFDDNGEPSQTAGYPMLQILQAQDIRQVLLCAVRYFGGVKLGKGGLIRAYTQTAQRSLEAAGTKDILEVDKWRLEYDYAYHGSVEHIMGKEKILGTEPLYSANIKREIYLDEPRVFEELRDISDGRIRSEYLGRYYLDASQGLRELEQIK